MHPHAAIIAALGGHREVARVLSVDDTRPIHWRRLGIPTRHWPRLVAVAKERGVEGVTWDSLTAADADGAEGVHGAEHTHDTLRLSQHDVVKGGQSLPQMDEAP